MNPSGMAIDRDGYLFVSSRNDGTIHRVSADGRSMQWIEGMGIATGLAFDPAGNLYVGDRSGTIFKIGAEPRNFRVRDARAFDGRLPSGVQPRRRAVYGRTDHVEFRSRVPHQSRRRSEYVFFAGLGRPQGIAFDKQGNLYVAASLAGRRGIVRITPQAEAELALSGSNIVGLALQPSRRAMITTNNALYSLDWDVQGLPLNG